MTNFTLEQVQAQAALMLEKGNQEVHERLAAIDTEDKVRMLSLPEQDQLDADMAIN
jgi:hypothetical protein